MKKTSILFACLMSAGFFANAQTRMSLYEEFTGENCPPCAATNPGLNTLLGQPTNTALIIPIKWQVAIPSAPSTTWSLYQTDASEINSRMNYYSVNSAPNGRIDGQGQTVFGAASDHPADMSSAIISTAATYTTPFAITMNAAWDATYSNAVVTITVTSSQTFTSNGSFLFRLVLVERTINFATAPGTNGEKDFEDAARKSYPNITGGTSLPGTWTAAQAQTYTINCAAPSYIVDKSKMAFVGFVQDEGNKKVWQAARTSPLVIPNDAKLTAYSMPSYSCSNSINPSITILNQGPNSITAMTITPVIDGTNQTPFTWAGTLASSASTNITLGSYPASNGNHTVTFNISNVSGGDVNTANNVKTGNTALIQTYVAGPVVEPFTSSTFPPSNWFVVNTNQGPTWSRNSGAGFNGAGCSKYDFYSNSATGDADDMYLIPTNFTGIMAPMLSFDVAYAQYNAENDKLEAKVSTDCGATWTTIFNKAGTVLKTVAPQTSAFTPASNSQWRNETVALPAAAGNNPSVLVKFVATSAYGNNLYVDNVNVSQSTAGIKTNNAEAFSVQLYPNPSTEFTNLDVTVKTGVSATVNVFNSIGQLVVVKNVQLNEGYNNISIDTKNLATGVYNVVLSSENGTSTKKLTVSK